MWICERLSKMHTYFMTYLLCNLAVHHPLLRTVHPPSTLIFSSIFGCATNLCMSNIYLILENELKYFAPAVQVWRGQHNLHHRCFWMCYMKICVSQELYECWLLRQYISQHSGCAVGCIMKSILC